MKLTSILLFIFTSLVVTQGNSQELSVFPGFLSQKYYEDNNEISRQEFDSLLTNEKQSSTSWKKTKRDTNLSLLAAVAEIGCVYWALSAAANQKNPTAPIVGLIATTGISVGFSLSASKHRREAILAYNESKDFGSLNIGQTANGLGLVVSF